MHPRFKRIPGARLAAAALTVVYGQQVPYIPASAVAAAIVDGNGTGIGGSASSTSFSNAVRVAFPAGARLFLTAQPSCPTAYGAPESICTGWQLQGIDNILYAASATVTADGGAVIVTATSMPRGVTPVAVRYAYSPWPLTTLFDSQSGMPVNAFALALPAVANASAPVAGSAGIGGSPAPPPLRIYVDCKRALNMADVRARPPTGSLASPYWSLLGARDAIRRLPRPLSRPVTVLVLPGDCYPRTVDGVLTFDDAVLILDAADSGTAAAPITYQPLSGGGSVRLLGGLRLDPSLWKSEQTRAPGPDAAAGGYPAGEPITALVLNISEAVLAAGGNAATMRLTPLGSISNPSGSLGGCGSANLAELFYGGRPMVLARYPNMRLDGINNVIFVQSVIAPNATGGATSVQTVNSRPALRWQDEKDPWLLGFWLYDW